MLRAKVGSLNNEMNNHSLNPTINTVSMSFCETVAN